METKANLIGPLLEKAGQYSKTSVEQLKLQSLDKVSDISSMLISRLLFVIAGSLFLLTLNIAIALWLGEIMGKSYYGFLVVTAFYGLLGIVLLLVHPLIKAHVNNSIVKQMLKDKV